MASVLDRWTAFRGARPARAAFLGVFAATSTCFLAIGAALPVLPRYVTGPIGAGDVSVGIVIGAFAVTALVGRPLGGRLADRRGRRRVQVIGLSLCAVAGLMHLLPLGVGGLVAARLVLGFGDGWVFTAGLAWAIDLSPRERQGQAIALFGLAVWGGLTVGSVLGEAVLGLGGFPAVWLTIAALPAAGALLARVLPEAPREPFPSGPGEARQGFIAREALGPGALLALANVGYGTLAAFVVLHLQARGIAHPTAAFTTFAATVVVARIALGTLPDRLGARRIAGAAATAQAIGLVVIAAATTLPAALAGAVLMGLGSSLIFPALALLVVQRVAPERRGVALGTFTAFFDAGVGLGAPLAGAIAASRGYPAAFVVAAALAAAAATGAALLRRRATV